MSFHIGKHGLKAYWPCRPGSIGCRSNPFIYGNLIAFTFAFGPQNHIAVCSNDSMYILLGHTVSCRRLVKISKIVWHWRNMWGQTNESILSGQLCTGAVPSARHSTHCHWNIWNAAESNFTAQYKKCPSTVKDELEVFYQLPQKDFLWSHSMVVSRINLARINVQLPTPHLSPIFKHRLPIRPWISILIQRSSSKQPSTHSFQSSCPTQMHLDPYSRITRT